MNELEHKKKILILDDEVLCELVARVIQTSDRVFYLATTAERARTVLEIQEVDLILLDPNIENGSGMALLEDLRLKSPAFRRQPQKIVISADGSRTRMPQGEEAVYFLAKPFQISELRTLVHELLAAN